MAMRAGGRRLEAADHAQQRGLAGAGGAEQADELAVADGQVEALDRADGAEALGDAADLEDGHLGSATPGATWAPHVPAVSWARRIVAPSSARAPKPRAKLPEPMTRRAKSSATKEGTQRITDSTAPYWITGWLLMKEIISTGMVRICGAPISQAPSVS